MMIRLNRIAMVLVALIVAFTVTHFVDPLKRLSMRAKFRMSLRNARVVKARLGREKRRGIVRAGAPMILLPRAAKTGTLSIADLRAVTFQSAAAYGLDTISEIFQRDLAVHTAIVADLLGPLAETSADRQRIAGSSDRGQMVEADEYGKAPTQRVTGGTTVAFPLRNYQYAIGWTRKYLQNHTPAELADQITAAKKAHMIEISRQIRRAFYFSENYTFQDFLVDRIDLAVKRLTNADGAPIPDGPNGEQFDGDTHSHYLGTAAFVAANLTSVIRTVVEHGYGGKVIVVINIAQEAAVRALTGFTPYLDARVTLNANANQATQRLDMTRLDNRAIGIFDSAEIWIKPWGVANKILAFDSTSGAKPLVVRTRAGGAPTLVIAAELETFPLHAQVMESEFGVGVWNRQNGAVLDIANAEYTDPTI